jgi:hypothetical protein
MFYIKVLMLKVVFELQFKNSLFNIYIKIGIKTLHMLSHINVRATKGVPDYTIYVVLFR